MKSLKGQEMISKVIKVTNPMHSRYLQEGYVEDIIPSTKWFQVRFPTKVKGGNQVAVRPSDCQILEDDF